MCSVFLPLYIAFAVYVLWLTSLIMNHIFTGRKDRRTACTLKNCFMSFPPAASSFNLESSPAAWSLQPQGQGCRVTLCLVGNHILRAPCCQLLLQTLSPELCFNCSCPCLSQPRLAKSAGTEDRKIGNCQYKLFHQMWK